MPRHSTFLTRARDTIRSSRNPAPPAPTAGTRISLTQEQYPNWPGRNGPVTGLDAFRFNFGDAGPEFRTDISFPRRLRQPTFEEMTERFGRGQIGQLEAIAAGTGFRRRLRDPSTGQLIDAPSRGSNRGQVPFEDVPSFNIDISGIRNSLNQQAGEQRQNFAAAAGNRRDPRLSGVRTAAINQGFAGSFGAQAAANTNLISDVQRANIQTRLFGVQGQQDLLGQFRAEAGRRAGINLSQQGLRLGLEELKVGKEGQDLRAALEKRRLGIQSFTARERAVLARYNAYLRQQELSFNIRQAEWENKYGWIGDLFGTAGDIVTSL